MKTTPFLKVIGARGRILKQCGFDELGLCDHTELDFAVRMVVVGDIKAGAYTTDDIRKVLWGFATSFLKA